MRSAVETWRPNNGTITLPEVAVIGAGPAGLQTALRLRAEGREAIVIDQGGPAKPSKLCAGLVSCRGAHELGLALDGSVLNRVRGARFYAPNGRVFQVERDEPVAYVIDRGAFNRILRRRVEQRGIPVLERTRLRGFARGELLLAVEGREVRASTRYLVGADGAVSTVRRLLAIRPAREGLLATIQAECAGLFDDEFVEIHLGDFARGFFAWVVPTGPNRARIGLGSLDRRATAEALQAFLRRRFPEAVTLEARGAFIPVGPPLEEVERGPVALVGDAAFQTKATTGGGIVFGMKAATLLGESLAERLRGRKAQGGYERRLRPLARELRLHWMIRRFLNGLAVEQVDELFAALRRRGFERFLSEECDMDLPSTLVAKLAQRPRLWPVAAELLRLATR